MKKTYDAAQNLSPIYRAAQYIGNADAIIIIAAGAGMSVDSGLPAFRGSEGLWATLLPDGMREGEIGSLTQAKCFAARPVQARKFYGRALEVCRDTPPHDGYRAHATMGGAEAFRHICVHEQRRWSFSGGGIRRGTCRRMPRHDQHAAMHDTVRCSHLTGSRSAHRPRARSTRVHPLRETGTAELPAVLRRAMAAAPNVKAA